MKFAITASKPTAISVPTVPLDPKQEKLWTQSRAKLILVAPGFVHLWFKMMNPAIKGHAVFTTKFTTAATDGSHLIINPEFFFKLKLGQRIFVILHEIFHAMFNHPIMFTICRNQKCVRLQDGTALPWDEECMQAAADFMINDGIMQSGIDGVELLPGVWYDPTFISFKDNLFQAYAKLYRLRQSSDGGGGGSGGGFDIVLRPGEIEAKQEALAVQERPEQAWKVAIKAAKTLQRLQGKLPAVLEHLFDQILEPTVSFEDYIEGFFKRKAGGGRYDFCHPDRRYISRPDGPIYTPRRTGFGCECVVIAGDTSGSVSDKTIDMFLGNVKGILEDVKPQRIVLMWCDAKLHRTDEVEDFDDIVAVKRKGAPGRGGTDFRPVFNAVREMGLSPDALVYLTDGDGDFPSQAPSYPVLWGDISKQPSKYPFGEVVFVPQQK